MSDVRIEDVTNELRNSDISAQLDVELKSKLSNFSFSKESLFTASEPASIEYTSNSNVIKTRLEEEKLAQSTEQSSEVHSEDPEENIKSTLTNLLSAYHETQGVQVNYEGLDDAIRSIITSSKSDREVAKAIQGDLAATMSEVLIFKSIIVIGKVIDSQLNGILSRDHTETLSGETVSILNQMFSWIERLEEIKKKYSQFDLTKKIRDITSSKSDVTKRTELELKLIEMLRSGLDANVQRSN